MKNLFDYATKELSQDAFLRWLFESGFDENCENESVRNASRTLFNIFTKNKFKYKEIKELKTVAQWKNIDISIWFKVDGKEHLIIIEDKTESGVHDNQLDRYEKEINDHNNFWRNETNRKKYTQERYLEKDSTLFKVFYKTNIIDDWEKEYANEQNGWETFDIFDIYNIFKGLQTDNEVLGYYKEHIEKIYSSASRKDIPSNWDLISWHSFFNSYEPCSFVSPKTEINCYQKEYYYIKLFVKDHEKDLPCFEIRSRDFKVDSETGKCSIIARAVLYNLSDEAQNALTKDKIIEWQGLISNYGFKLNQKSDINKHKQIGNFVINDIENNEESLTNALDYMCELLNSIFSCDKE